MADYNASFFLIRTVKCLARSPRTLRPDASDEEIRGAVLEAMAAAPRHELADRLIACAIAEGLAEGPIEGGLALPPGVREEAGPEEGRGGFGPRMAALLDPAEGWKVS